MSTINLQNTRGSEWRKWDLHIHTPESLTHNYQAKNNNDVWETYIKDLESLPNEIKILGINDYLFIDGYKKVLEYKSRGRLQNIDLILPVIELRLAKFCGNKQFKRINFHIIFSNEVSADIIQSQFLNGLSVKYKLDSNCNQQNWGGVITRENLKNLGKAIKTTVPQAELRNYDSDIKEGFNNLNLETEQIFEILHNAEQYFAGKYLTCIGKTEWDSLNWDDNSIAEKKNIINLVDIVFTAAENIENFNKAKSKLIESNVNSLLLDCSDAHNNSDSTNKDRIGNCNTWIKADPTFEGLKQIIFEPKERVKIQKTNPAFDFEKSPFTEIQIGENVEVFADEQDNVTFEKCTLPLNNGLVSIIGGRGTGKSILIDYISAGLDPNTKKKNYTKSDKITIKRQTSLKEEATSFVLSDNPNVPFMYISQSEIKSIVEKPQDFTKNIRETIGVTDNYVVSREYQEKTDKYINEYFGVIKILETDGTNSLQKKESIDKEIKRNNDFITSITSQENKEKLEKYQSHIKKLEWKKSFLENLKKQREIVLQFEHNTNVELQKINESITKLNLKIPLLNNSDTTNYILNSVIPAVEASISETEGAINNTKNAFADYSGDLTTLLNDVAKFQNKVTELQGQKVIIEENERIFETIKQNSFKELGAEIESSISAYKQEIENKWLNFKNGSIDYTDEQKQLLSDILGEENLNVAVEIRFDTERMYQLLMQKLDGRSWNTEKLQHTLNVSNLNEYISFIRQIGEINTFGDQINPIRSYILDVFFRKYNEFITHNIVVTSKNKNITKLSHGQQGTIYLRLKLAANLFSKTIIYDQPEDDLDNEFIMSDLVSIFRKIKKYRQIIIVSHNANLVVNADSEQVIIARNKEGILKYVSGSLENTNINEQICKILEGGKSAFLNREKKYGFKK